MKDSKVYSVLEALDIVERNRLHKFLLSPYFNKKVELIQLFTILDEHLKNASDSELNKYETWNKLFSKQEFNDTKFRKLTSDLLKLIEEFFIIEKLQSNPLHKANYLLESLADKKIEKLYNSSIATARRMSKQQMDRSASYYYYQYQIEKNLFDLTSEFEKKVKAKKDWSLINYTEIVENLDYFYLGEKLRYVVGLFTAKNITNIQDNINFLDEVINQAKKLEPLNIPPISIYYKIYLSTIEPDVISHFEDLKTLIGQYLHLFPKEAKDIFESALNYCIRKVNRGRHDFHIEAFDLYEYGLEERILFTDGILSPTSFRNIVINGLRCEKYEWVEKFIHRYGDSLEKKYRDNAVHFNLARVLWYKKEYNIVIELLRDVEYEDLMYNLNSKALLLGSFYEQDEVEALLSYCQSFTRFIRRNRSIIPSRKESFLNLISFTKKLVRIQPRDQKSISQLKTEVEQAPAFVNKSWILEKIAELEGVKIG